MKTKLSDAYEWRRVFKIFPVETQDGYRVAFSHVWKRKYETLGGHDYSYHTNPDGLEDKYQAKLAEKRMTPLTEGPMRRGSNPMPPVKRPKRPPPPAAPPPKYPVDSPGSSSLAIGRVVLEEKGREANVCPDCGTIDCYKGPAKFSISGAGVLSTTSKDIMKSCKTRQQLNALEKLNISGKRKRKSTLGEPKELPKNQKLGYYTGSTGPL